MRRQRLQLSFNCSALNGNQWKSSPRDDHEKEESFHPKKVLARTQLSVFSSKFDYFSTRRRSYRVERVSKWFGFEFHEKAKLTWKSMPRRRKSENADKKGEKRARISRPENLSNYSPEKADNCRGVITFQLCEGIDELSRGVVKRAQNRK